MIPSLLLQCLKNTSSLTDNVSGNRIDVLDLIHQLCWQNNLIENWHRTTDESSISALWTNGQFSLIAMPQNCWDFFSWTWTQQQTTRSTCRMRKIFIIELDIVWICDASRTCYDRFKMRYVSISDCRIIATFYWITILWFRIEFNLNERKQMIISAMIYLFKFNENITLVSGCSLWWRIPRNTFRNVIILQFCNNIVECFKWNFNWKWAKTEWNHTTNKSK